LTDLIGKDRPIISTVARAAVLAEVSEATIRRRLHDGDGVREFARPPASWVNGRSSVQPVMLVYVPYEDALPAGYVTVRAAATECSVAEATITQWAQRVGAPTAVTQRGKWFVNVNDARERFNTSRPAGWIEFSELTTGTPFTHRSVRNRLVQLVGRNEVAGVKILGHPTRWYFPPELREELPRLFPGRCADGEGELPIAG
jgi:hypothetical protein